MALPDLWFELHRDVATRQLHVVCFVPLKSKPELCRVIHGSLPYDADADAIEVMKDTLRKRAVL